MRHLQRLFAHLRWADEQVLAALRAATSAPEGAVQLYAHVLASEYNWLARLAGTAQIDVLPALSLHACEELARDSHARFDAFVASLSPADLDQVVAYRRRDGQAQERRLEDILLHVALHAMYHRGQVATLLRQAGETPNATDFITWSGEAS